MRNSTQVDDDVVDTITLMEYEAGELTDEETIRMVATLLSTGQLIELPSQYQNLANQYIREGVVDEDGDINFIKLKEYM